LTKKIWSRCQYSRTKFDFRICQWHFRDQSSKDEGSDWTVLKILTSVKFCYKPLC